MQKPVSLCSHSEPVIRLLDAYDAKGVCGDPVELPSTIVWPTPIGEYDES
jgi:hypothetical protein